MKTRQEHLDWCKQRALEYVAVGDLDQAMACMIADLGKHSDTANDAAKQIMLMMRMGGLLSTAHEMSKFIHGFN